MARKPPFDPIRAAFFLLAGVIGVHALVILGFAGACLYHSEVIIASHTPDINCDPNSRLMGLLTAALAAALAFAGVRK
jgi:hypothetical protein